VEEVLKLDELSKTPFWCNVIAKEMKNVMPAFKFIDNDKPPIGYKKIPCHMIFAIKSDITCKARLVAGGHMTDIPKESVYASAVSRDSVRLVLMLASLNDLKFL
jgi:hypothetical protein